MIDLSGIVKVAEGGGIVGALAPFADDVAMMAPRLIHNAQNKDNGAPPKVKKPPTYGGMKLASFIDEFQKIAKQSEFKKLQKNRVPLTDEERAEVMKRQAVWHHGPNGEPTPAVWKSVDKKTGKTSYVTHTHRAYQSRSDLNSAIGRYHKFIKETA